MSTVTKGVSLKQKRGITYHVRGAGKLLKDIVYRIRTFFTSKQRYIAARQGAGFGRNYIVCYPDVPDTMHAFYEIAHALGLSITNKLRSDAAAYVHFEDTTERDNRTELAEAAGDKRVINGACVDISKEKVEEIFSRVFGYGMKVDPRTHTGTCVEKPNENSVGGTRVATCPREPQPGFVYQKLIDSVEGDMAVNLRVSVFGDTLPLAYIRYKPVGSRFEDSKGCVRVALADVFSKEEYQKTILFCQELRLDYGELDVMRDKHDGRIYIVDANNTPYSPQTPPRQLNATEHQLYVDVSGEHFRSAFLNEER